MNPTPNVFSFVEKQDLAGKCLLRIGPMNPAEIARDLSTEALCHPRLKTWF